MFWVLVYSKVLLGLQRRSVHNLRLCHRLVPRNVGPLVVGGGLCAQQLNVLCHVHAGWVYAQRDVNLARAEFCTS